MSTLTRKLVSINVVQPKVFYNRQSWRKGTSLFNPNFHSLDGSGEWNASGPQLLEHHCHSLKFFSGKTKPKLCIYAMLLRIVAVTETGDVGFAPFSFALYSPHCLLDLYTYESKLLNLACRKNQCVFAWTVEMKKGINQCVITMERKKPVMAYSMKCTKTYL